MSFRVFQVAVRHPGLNTYRVISGTDWYTVNMKARLQYEAWEQEWRRSQQGRDMRDRAEADARKRAERAEREKAQRRCHEWAAGQTAEARAAIEAVRRTLERALAVDDALDWNALVDRTEFSKARPEPVRVKPPPEIPSPGDPPDPNDSMYQPDIGIADRLSASRRDAKVAEAAARLEADRSVWARRVTDAREARAANEVKYADALRRAERESAERMTEWERERDAFVAARDARNTALADRRRRYEAGEPEAVVEYCHMVLARSEYPDSYPRDAFIEYVADTKTLVVDFALPPIECVPEVKSVAFDPEAEKFEVTRLSATERAALHETLLYQLPLRTAHEMFEADRVGAVGAVAFNGWIGTKPGDPETGTCVLSLLVDRERFAELDLAVADPKACFKLLGGVGWSEHYNLDPVAPIVDTERSRTGLWPGARPTASLYGGVGLDEMPIEDFEHLTRELLVREVAGPDERVSIARVAGGLNALIVTGAPSRRVRVVVHARRAAGSCTRDALRALREAAEYERADEALFIATGEADGDVRNLALASGVALVDGPRLLNLLARHAGRIGVDMRPTSELESQS